MKRRNMCTRIVIPGFLLIFCLNIAIYAASANTIYVDGDGGGGFTQIQDAINASSPGDIILINKSVQPYRENIIVNKSLIIRGNVSSHPVIDGQSTNALNISANDSIIQNLIITNCTTNGSSSILVFDPMKIIENISLENISFNNCSYGIVIKNTTNITIKFCNINNSADAGIHLCNISNGNVNNLILHNVSGKALYLENVTLINISTSKISNISRKQNINGTGIEIVFSECLDVFNNTISFCEDDGIYLNFSSNVNISKNIMTNNSYGIKLNC